MSSHNFAQSTQNSPHIRLALSWPRSLSHLETPRHWIVALASECCRCRPHRLPTVLAKRREYFAAIINRVGYQGLPHLKMQNWVIPGWDL